MTSYGQIKLLVVLIFVHLGAEIFLEMCVWVGADMRKYILHFLYSMKAVDGQGTI